MDTDDTLDRYLDFVVPHLPAALVARAALARVRRVAALLPGALAFGTYGFEVPLGRPAAEADFLVSLSRARGGPRLLAGVGTAAGWASALSADRRWAGVGAFGAAWATGDGTLGALDHVWLEFDLRGRPHGLPAPCLFFSPQPLDGADRADTPADVLTGRLEDAHLCAAGRPLPPSVTETLARVLAVERLRRGLFQVGFMLARREGGVRLVAGFGSLEALLETLEACGWPGDRAAARSLAETALAAGDFVAAHLDVSRTVSPMLGLEISFAARREPCREPRWAALLGRLVDDGLCTPAKRAGMLAYPGHETSAATGVPLPPALAAEAEARGPAEVSVWVRKLYHVKLVSRPDRPLEAKGYLSVDHHWHEVDPIVRAVLRVDGLSPDSRHPEGPRPPGPA